MHRDDVLKVRIESELTTLRLCPLMTLLSRTAADLYRLDSDGILSSDSTSRVSCLLRRTLMHVAGSVFVAPCINAHTFGMIDT